jgi:hypothetical protein
MLHQSNDDYAFDEDGCLKDGHTARFRMAMKDAMAMRDRPRVTDGFGRPPGSRPGFLISDHGRQAKQQAYLDYENWVGNRWRDQEPNPPVGAQAGDVCTVRNAEYIDHQGEPGHMRWVAGALICVPDSLRSRQRANGSNGDPDLDPEMAQSDHRLDRHLVANVQKAHARKMDALYQSLDQELASRWRNPA